MTPGSLTVACVKPVISTVTKSLSCQVKCFFLFYFFYTFIDVYKSNLQRLFESLCFVLSSFYSCSLTTVHGDLDDFRFCKFIYVFLGGTVVFGNAPHVFFFRKLFIGHRILSVAFIWILLMMSCLAPLHPYQCLAHSVCFLPRYTLNTLATIVDLCICFLIFR